MPSPSPTAVNILARVLLPEKFVGTVIPDDAKKLIHADEPGVLEVRSQDGTERVLAYRPIVLPTSPLYIGAGFSKTKAFAPFNRSTVINALVTYGGAALAFLASIFIGDRFLVAPIARIAAVMQRWREEYLDPDPHEGQPTRFTGSVRPSTDCSTSSTRHGRRAGVLCQRKIIC